MRLQNEENRRSKFPYLHNLTTQIQFSLATTYFDNSFCYQILLMTVLAGLL